MNKNIKFHSIFGYSKTAAKKGDRIPVVFRVNCKDGHSDKLKREMAKDALNSIIYPQISILVGEGKLPADFRLWQAHLLMFGEESRNQMLLNENARFVCNVLYKKNKKFNGNTTVDQGDIEDVIGLYPTTKCDPNAAHVMLIKLNNKWYYAADLIYNKDKVMKRLNVSKLFLKVSGYCLTNEIWGPFVDNLFSATELSIQSTLLLLHYGAFSTKQSHDNTVELYSGFTKNGNAEIRFSDHYKNLNELRKKGRYLTNLHGHFFSLDQKKAVQLMKITTDLVRSVDQLLTSIDIDRKPKAGYYVAFGEV